MKRLNLGCGSVQPEGWVNADTNTDHFKAEDEDHVYLDVTGRTFRAVAYRENLAGNCDAIVCNHMLSDIGHHDLPAALKNIYALLPTGGVLRILVPDVFEAFNALMRDDEEWFPQDERTGSIEAKFCTFVTWFGESRSVFTWGYLAKLLIDAGFEDVSAPLNVGQTRFDPDRRLGITDLDGDRTTALIVEAIR